MFMDFFFLAILAVPAIVLLWRTIVSKQKWPVRIGAACAAMLTVVGAVGMPRFVYGDSDTYRLQSAREAIALLAATVGPAYLLFWSRKHRGRGKSKTISIIAAIIGLVPIVATVAIILIYSGEH